MRRRVQRISAFFQKQACGTVDREEERGVEGVGGGGEVDAGDVAGAAVEDEAGVGWGKEGNGEVSGEDRRLRRSLPSFLG